MASNIKLFTLVILIDRCNKIMGHTSGLVVLSRSHLSRVLLARIPLARIVIDGGPGARRRQEPAQLSIAGFR